MKTIDVSLKPETLRSAKAYGRIRLKEETVRAIREGRVPKGDVLSSCRLAGIMASKKTSELLPFCHPVSFQHVELEVKVGKDFIEVFSFVKGVNMTGYEMEALTAVSVALLTIYDMCKGMDDSMVIEEVRLLEKSGGKSQWAKGLDGVGVKVLSEGSIGDYIKDRLLALGAFLTEDGFKLIVSTKRLDLSEVWGVSHAINQKLFSLVPERLKEGVRVGRLEGRLCVEIQEDEWVVRSFFDSFGHLLGCWIDAEAL